MKRKDGLLRGFTLIELLVVITVIGLLAAIIVPAIAGALKGAKKARAMSQVRDLDGAIKRYYAEYGRMPVPQGDNGGSDKLYTGAAQAKVIEILINTSTITNANPKQIVFLDLDPTSFGVKRLYKADTGGDLSVQEMLADGKPYKDPWGDPNKDDGREYGILMDLNFDDKITGLGGYGDIRAKAAVYSLGEAGAVNVADPPYKTW